MKTRDVFVISDYDGKLASSDIYLDSEIAHGKAKLLANKNYARYYVETLTMLVNCKDEVDWDEKDT